ncbi:MAG: DUF177 domain-containing protein [Candidatus Omnitrophica bacterium]|nr:DUF177 domain-containing protein [Candidatus Omnitrophota bacterium]
MKIRVHQVPAEGLTEQRRYDPEEMDLARFDVHPTDPIALSCFIAKADRELIVQATLRYGLQMACAKCLETFVSPMTTAATLNYHVAPTDVVDITDDLRQEIILSYPMIPVCQPDCRGLCVRCGQNRNHGLCSCVE